MADLLQQLWLDARRAVDAGGAALRQRAADCALVALCEAARSVANPTWAATARSLARGGPCTVPGAGGASPVDAVVANGFLIHAGLADDAYKVAHHPGLTVVPAALAAVESHKAPDDALLPAIAFGYEFSCRLADLLLPETSQRGWRVTAVVAPVVAAGVSALVRGGYEEGVDATRLATGVMGGPIHPVNSDGDWRLQPALAGAAGVVAASTVGVHRPRSGGLEAEGGPLAHFTGRPAARIAGAAPRLPQVVFKRHGVAMYGQAVYDAVAQLPRLAVPVDRVVVTVPHFAAEYGGRSREGGESVASVAGLAVAALAAHHEGAPVTDRDRVEVRADDAVGPLGARITVRLLDGREHEAAGSGDTSDWGPEEIEAQCRRRTGADVAGLRSALHATPAASAAAVCEAWMSLAAAVRIAAEPVPVPPSRG